MTADESPFRRRTLERLARVTSALPGGDAQRKCQIRMTGAVADTIVARRHAVIEAGTGTGKSLAYLIPAVEATLSGLTTIIATATRALQDQLDDVLTFITGQCDDIEADFAILKGRQNYPCQATRGCPGPVLCPRDEHCLHRLARNRAANADIVVVNHHLYSTELKNKEILRDHDIVIIDDAHRFHDVMADIAGSQINPARVHATGRSVASVIGECGADEAADEAANRLYGEANRLSEELRRLIGSRLVDGPVGSLADALDSLRSAADWMLNLLRMAPEDDISSVGFAYTRRLVDSLINDIDVVRSPSDNDVVWVEEPETNPSLRSTPIQIDGMLHESLWSQRTAVLVSATLSEAAAAPLGLPPDTLRLKIESPFDYESNTRLYCATHLRDPRHRDHRDAQLDVLELLMRAADGRTLGLFTSLEAMREATHKIRRRLGHRILMQDDAPQQSLLRQFIDEPETSLFATMSFWQGIDIPGSTCILVAIDRLPFSPPGRPPLQARKERAGAEAFDTIDLPIAATLLAQGAGRLIRSAADRGVVAVLDPRLATAGYKWNLIDALPPMTRTKDLEEVMTFLRSIRNGDRDDS